jgi:hypothetical protein
MLFNGTWQKRKLLFIFHGRNTVVFAVGIQFQKVLYNNISCRNYAQEVKKTAKDSASAQQLVVTMDLQNVNSVQQKPSA